MSQSDLIHNIELLTKAIRKQNSLTYTFINGIVKGVGITIGASVVAAIALSVLQFFTDLLPVL